MRRLLLLIALIAAAMPASARMSERELREKLGRLPEDGHRRAKALLHTDLGTVLYKDGRMAEAATELEAALQQNPSKTLRRHIYLYLGKSYESSGRLDRAISAYEQSTQLDRKNWRRHRDLAGLYEDVHLYRKAIDSYTDAMRLNPREASIVLSLGRSWRKLGLYTQGEPCLQQAHVMDPDSTEIHRELAMVHEGQGRFVEAALDFSKSLNAQATIEEAARLVYLAVLGGNKDLARSGIALLKSKDASAPTISFYKNLAERLNGGASNEALVQMLGLVEGTTR